jgi:CheY-like chemotaxis protein
MKILLAEDEEDIQRLASMCLGRGGEWEVTLADDGEEALALARQERPDVILLDVMMPKLDGFTVCQRLKADPSTRNIHVIFLTASAQEAQTQRGLAIGAIGYLHKPFDPLKLPQQVMDLVTKASASSASG